MVDAGTQFGIIDVSGPLFKRFTDAGFADALAARGEIRVGTLYEFRDADGWDKSRGDATEGVYDITLISEKNEIIRSDTASWFLKPIVEQLGVPIASHGGQITAGVKHPDCFIYCVSSERSEVLDAEYGPYCVEIHEPDGFFASVTEALWSAGLITGDPHGYAAPCLYRGRNIDISSSTTPVEEPPIAFLKPVERAHEREVRAVWHPRAHPIAALVGTIPELSRFCRRIR